MTPNQNSFAPHFLSRFPRSLSSLSLGTKKKSSTDKNVTSPTGPLPAPQESTHATDNNRQTPIIGNSNGATGQTRNLTKNNSSVSSSSHKKKHSRSESKSKADNVQQPPPLPERNNVGRKSLLVSPENPSSPNHVVTRGTTKNNENNKKISDLDASITSQGSVKGAVQKSHNISLPTESSGSRKRSKGKKAHSDPKISTQAFLQMEMRSMSDGSEPPPLPPRPTLAEPVQNLGNSTSNSGIDTNGRCLPNSINTCMNYPLVATCTPVRDNFSAFPLSHRPNIVQQLQLQQQMQQQQNKSTVSNKMLNENVKRMSLQLCELFIFEQFFLHKYLLFFLL